MEIKLKDTKTKNNTAKIAECLSFLMSCRNIFHAQHLSQTGAGSFARHLALNEIYDSIVGHIDELAEKYQGYHGVLIKGYSGEDITKYVTMDPKEFITYLLNYVEEERQEAFGDVSMLQNLVDELVGDIASARYKLLFLS